MSFATIWLVPTLVQDLRYALRNFRRSPAFTTIAVLTLTLGIGATAAIFSVVDAVLLRALPYRDPQRLVSVFEDETSVGFPRDTPAPGNYADWKAQTRIFEDAAAIAGRVYSLTGNGMDPEEVRGAAVTQNLFPVLGAKAAIGRVFQPDEDRPGAAHVAVLSHGLWKRRFGGDPDLVGRDILMSGEKYKIVGVMPRSFSYPARDTEIWTPIAFTPKQLAERGSHYLTVVAKLRPGVTPANANAVLKVLAERLAKAYPKTNAGIDRFFVEPLQDTYTRNARTGLLVLLAAVGCILLIACANIANLLLSRATGRLREMAVRTALGAVRGRIVRQMLTESALLAGAGSVLGIVLAGWCFTFLNHLIPEDLSGSVSLTLDIRMLAFMILISLASTLLFGMAPAVQMSRIEWNEALKEGGRGSAGSRRVFRNLLVIGEVALSLMLLVGCGLLLASFSKLRGIDPGFHADHVLTVRLYDAAGQPDFTKRSEFFERVLDRVRALPGVEAAGFTSALPLTWDGGTDGFIPERRVLDPRITYDANNRVVTPGYFEAMRIPLRRGRLFQTSDGPDAPPVAIINETMAHKFWPNEDPVGQRFQFDNPSDKPRRIIGVVADVRQMRLDQPPRQEMYFPYWQARNNWMVPRDLAVRTSAAPASLANAVRAAIWSADKDQPISFVMTLDDLLDQEVAQRRVQAMLMGGFAALALILACVGIYGVLSYLVTQRTREIGVRVALGASATDVFRSIAAQGLAVTSIGMAIGCAGALALSRFLGSMLFGVKAADPLTYVAAITVFAAVAPLAAYLPARRAARVDPMVALRYE